ncbi:MAG: D-alanyl-D-alanine dipeptidase [Cyanobacterium sp. T60_A2020_053]|nr:D-alanyl-D-alanine dipeptidase [Cyanobacterium sp. T60_A2020_053]
MMEKAYQKVIIKECQEPLLPIPLDIFTVATPPPYEAKGADYQGKSPYYLREGVIEALIKAQEKLQQLQVGWRFYIFDAYRPISVQQFMVDYTFQWECEKRGLNPAHLTAVEKDGLLQEVYKIWAIPSHNPDTPPPHSTGGAIDLTLMDENGNIIDMGGDIDEMSARAEPNYYLQFTEDISSQKYQQRRDLLLTAMTYGGFKRHLGEWWHFCLGDQMWAWLSNSDHPYNQYYAIYGAI